MTDFETAARKAAEAMREMCEYYSPTSDYIPPSARILETITKHHADLAETFGLLCELARAMQDVSNNRGTINLCKTVGMAINPEWIDKANAAEKSIVELLANPRIAALLAEKG